MQPVDIVSALRFRQPGDDLFRKVLAAQVRVAEFEPLHHMLKR